MAYPLSVHWLVLDDGALQYPVQVVIGAPKRKLHHAVERNRAKRMIRECYRLRKETLLSIAHRYNCNIALSINYISNDIVSYDQLGNIFDKLMEKLSEQLHQELNTSHEKDAPMA